MEIFLILMRRHAEFFSEPHDEIGAIRKATVQAGILNRLPFREQFFRLRKPFGLNKVGRRRLKAVSELAAERAFGNVKCVAKPRHGAGRLRIVLQDVFHDFRDTRRQALHLSDLVAFGMEKVKDLKKILHRAKWSFRSFFSALVEREARLNDPFFVLLGKRQKMIFFKSAFQVVGHERDRADPNAKMLMDAVAVVDATMHLIRRGNDNIPTMYSVKMIFHQKRDVSVEVDIDLIEIVDMTLVVRNVVGCGKPFFVGNFRVNIVGIFHQRFERWNIDHNFSSVDTKIAFIDKMFIVLLFWSCYNYFENIIAHSFRNVNI